MLRIVVVQIGSTFLRCRCLKSLKGLAPALFVENPLKESRGVWAMAPMCIGSMTFTMGGFRLASLRTTPKERHAQSSGSKNSVLTMAEGASIEDMRKLWVVPWFLWYKCDSPPYKNFKATLELFKSKTEEKHGLRFEEGASPMRSRRLTLIPALPNRKVYRNFAQNLVAWLYNFVASFL